MKKVILRILLILMVVLAIYLPYKHTINKGKFVKVGKEERYLYTDKTYPKNSWVASNLSLYYVDELGFKKTGIINDGEHYYYLDEDGHYIKNKLIQVKGKTIFAAPTGVLTTSGYFIKDRQSYFIKADGTLLKDGFIGDYKADKQGRLVKLKPIDEVKFNLTRRDAFKLPEFLNMKMAHNRYLTDEGQEMFYKSLAKLNDGYLDGVLEVDLELPKQYAKPKFDIKAVEELIGFYGFMPYIRDSFRQYKDGVKTTYRLKMTEESEYFKLKIIHDYVDIKVLETIKSGRDKLVDAINPDLSDVNKISEATKSLIKGKDYVINDNTHNSYCVYENGIGLCESFSTALVQVLNELGYETFIQSGFVDAFNGENGHGWVRVRLGEQWLNIDPTSFVSDKNSELILKDNKFFKEKGYIFEQIGK